MFNFAYVSYIVHFVRLKHIKRTTTIFFVSKVHLGFHYKHSMSMSFCEWIIFCTGGTLFLFYTTYIRIDLAQDAIVRTKAGERSVISKYKV